MGMIIPEAQMKGRGLSWKKKWNLWRVPRFIFIADISLSWLNLHTQTCDDKGWQKISIFWDKKELEYLQRLPPELSYKNSFTFRN